MMQITPGEEWQRSLHQCHVEICVLNQSHYMGFLQQVAFYAPSAYICIEYRAINTDAQHNFVIYK